MTRRWLVIALAALAVAAVSVSGCGESDKDKYVDDYKPLNDRLLKVGERIGDGTLRARRQTNERLARDFGGYAADLEDVRKDIARLDTPDDLKDESSALTRSIDDVVDDLRKISGAADEGNPRAAAAATLDLGDHARTVNQVQNKLAKATGADVGPR